MAKESLEELTQASYWDTRYSKDDAEAKVYDWLRSFDNIRLFLLKHLPPVVDDPAILHLGTGNSTMPMDLLALGWQKQTAVDFSAVIIANMRKEEPRLDWREMDIRSMTFNADSFDVCIDKATLDAMLYGSLWDPEPEVKVNVKAYVDEVLRVLKPGGLWLYITWRQPHFIRPLLQRGNSWTIDVETLSDGGGMLEYFAFVVRKAVAPATLTIS